MPWSLILSVIPLVMFVTFLIVHEHKVDKRFKEKKAENRECVRPIAKIANEKHKKKFGRPSTELNEVFPELKVVK